MQDSYRDNEEIRHGIKSLLALAFVPVHDIEHAFEELDLPLGIDNLVNYFEDTYIGQLRRGRRTQPRFPQSMWNVHSRVINSLPITNNSVEGWHRAFNATVKNAHIGLFSLIEFLRLEQSNVETKFALIRAGSNISNTQRKYKKTRAAHSNFE